MVVKVYGQFCSMYDALLKNVKMAIQDSGKNIDLKVYNKDADFVKDNVIYMPTLKINDRTVAEGKVLNKNEILELFNIV